MSHRIKLDTGAAKGRAQCQVPIFRASAVLLDFGLFAGSVPQVWTGITSVTLRVRAARLASVVLIEEVVTSFNTCTAAQWNAGSHEHFSVSLSAAQTALAMSAKVDTLHATLSALRDDGEVVVLGWFELVMHDANALPGTVAETVAPGLSLAEADARYVRGVLSADRVTFANGAFIYLNR